MYIYISMHASDIVTLYLAGFAMSLVLSVLLIDIVVLFPDIRNMYPAFATNSLYILNMLPDLLVKCRDIRVMYSDIRVMYNDMWVMSLYIVVNDMVVGAMYMYKMG